MFRTGRMLAYCDFSRQGVLAEHGSSEGWSFDVLSILAGTAVSLLFPWVPRERLRDSVQLSLDLDADRNSNIHEGPCSASLAGTNSR